jgi:stage V sporulation protein G
MSTDSTATVTFVVTTLQRIVGAGRLVALATVEIDLEGVMVLVQGMQVIRQRNRISTQAPRFRNPQTGAWTPAVILPDELGAAIAQELHRMIMRDDGRVARANILATPLGELIEDALTERPTPSRARL